MKFGGIGHRLARFGIVVVAALLVVGASTATAFAELTKRELTTKLVVVPGDFGPGYGASDGSVANPKFFAQVAKCTGTAITRKLAAAAGGPSITQHDTGATVNSNVAVVRTKAMATADQGVVDNAAFPGCLARVVQSQLAAQGVDTVGGTIVSSLPKVGDFSTAVQLDISGTTSAGQSQRVTTTDVFIRRGRAEVTVSFNSTNDQPYDATVVQSVLEKLDRRLQHVDV